MLGGSGLDTAFDKFANEICGKYCSILESTRILVYGNESIVSGNAGHFNQSDDERSRSRTNLSSFGGGEADDQGYGGIANFLYRHAQEERNHMTKIMGYILERGGRPQIQAIAAPPSDPSTLTECFQRVFRHEVDNTEAIYRIVNLAMEQKDWATWNFAQWFVKEQIEEEKLALELIDKLKIAGGDRLRTNRCLLWIRPWRACLTMYLWRVRLQRMTLNNNDPK
jgi:ferritin